MNKRHETAITPKSADTQTMIPGNPYHDGKIIRCAIYGSKVCQNPKCDGYTRLCTLWQRHSCR